MLEDQKPDKLFLRAMSTALFCKPGMHMRRTLAAEAAQNSVFQPSTSGAFNMTCSKKLNTDRKMYTCDKCQGYQVNNAWFFKCFVLYVMYLRSFRCCIVQESLTFAGAVTLTKTIGASIAGSHIMVIQDLEQEQSMNYIVRKIQKE